MAISAHLFSDRTALTIAGSDPSGGAGLQADLKTFQQLGVYGMSVVTLITVQNTLSVERVEPLPVDLVLHQLKAVMDDIRPRAIKTGALGCADVVIAVAEALRDTDIPLVIDPVLVSKHGHLLANDDVVDACRRHLLPLAWMVTPNRFEAEKLSGQVLNNDVSVQQAIQVLRDLGANNVLFKLGDVDGFSRHVLGTAKGIEVIDQPRLPARNTHGTGCVLAACLTANVARGITDVSQNVRCSIEQTLQAIRCDSQLGSGIHPAEIRAIPSPVD